MLLIVVVIVVIVVVVVAVVVRLLGVAVPGVFIVDGSLPE